jgi:hypothetical protein
VIGLSLNKGMFVKGELSVNVKYLLPLEGTERTADKFVYI